MPRNRLVWSCALTLLALALPTSAQAQTADIPAVARACDERTLGPEEKVLVFSETAGFRHASIPAGRTAICQAAGGAGIAVDWTEDSAIAFTDEALAQYDAVVFLSTTGDALDDAQQAAFEAYIRRGGGYAGIHAASDTEYGWQWYGGLVGAYFKNHPANQTATVKVSDGKHPSTAGLPQRWQRLDEWYNLRSNPRGDVHVLATLDETSYNAGDGAMGADHPTAWCHNYDGGRSWYTGGGHTVESYGEPRFRQHLLGGIRWAANLVPGECGATEWSNFERVTLAKGAEETGEPIGLAVLPDQSVLHTSRDGVVRYTDASGATSVAATIPVYSHDEDGLQAITLDPGFATNRWVYVYYAPPLSTPPGDAPFDGTPEQFAAFKGVNHLSRFKWDPQTHTLDLASEQKLLEVAQDRGICCHNGGDFAWDAAGNLYLSTGDDTNPFESAGSAPIDERPTRNPAFDAQRSSANTNDLRGKIVRIKPHPSAATYAIPSGNLFKRNETGRRPEIYAMGFRNPFRISVDRETGLVYVGDYGPDGGADPARGPDGQVEFSVLRKPGNYGWPYCIGNNEAYRDYDFATGASGPAFSCAAPVNRSPLNTGVEKLPAAVAPDIWYGTNGPWEEEMRPGFSESPMAGPVYHYDEANPSTTKFPAYYDDHWFPYEWGRDWIKETALDSRTGGPLEVSAFLDDPLLKWQNPMDMEFGPEGSLYVLDYGSNWFGGGPDSALYRVDYVKGGRRPIAVVSADRTTTAADTMTVQFSSEGSRDPDGDAVTYEWDFGDGTAKSTDPNPQHTYTAVGVYRATLTLTDNTGRSGTDDIQIVVGNAAPSVTITSPLDGGFFEFGDVVPFEVTATDEEDGTVSGDHPACARMRVAYLLGHDEHSHPITDATGCRGTFQTTGEAGHGDDANVFGLVSATYTDGGGRPGAPALTAQDGIRLWPRLLQAEHYVEQRGVFIYAQAEAGGGERIGSTEDDGTDGGVNYVAWEPVNLAGVASITIRAAAGGDGGPIEVRLGDPVNGELLGRIDIPNTGSWETLQDFTLPITPPAGKHKLVFAFPTGGMDVDQMRFNEG